MGEGLRDRKKRETRQRVSDVATKLFTQRGFDSVTIDEVAAASNVAKMTVFNYFARKEDLFFDRSDDAQKILRDVLARRGARSPLAALRAFVHESVAQKHGFVRMDARIAGFWKVVADSPALRARAREMSEDLERDLGAALAASVGAKTGDPIARLIAGILLGAWRAAFRDALRRQRAARGAARTEPFLSLVDRGFAAAHAAARGTPYA